MHFKYISVRYIIFIHNFSILNLKCSITVPSWLLKMPNIFTSRRDSHRKSTRAGSKEHLWELCTCLDTVKGRRLDRKNLHMMDVNCRSPVLDRTSSTSLKKQVEEPFFPPFFSLPLCEQQSCAFDKKHWLVRAHETSCPPSAFHRGHREVTLSANKLLCSSAKGRERN